ncbi:MAG: SagB/ThcOx family dehydrogenase [Ectothiorhodospiraceae bacterium]|jgi:SagB-type dehydrogenase family enzyme
MMIELPPPQFDSDVSIEQALSLRRSVRKFSSARVSPGALSQLLWAAAGQTDSEGHRTTPSAHALYPLDLWVATGRVEGITPALYRYAADVQGLTPSAPGDIRAGLADAAITDQPWVAEAAAILIVTARLTEVQAHFADQPPGDRGQRYAHIEAGSMAQSIALQATAIGCGSVLVGGFRDAAVQDLCRFTTDQAPLALICVGLPA